MPPAASICATAPGFIPDPCPNPNPLTSTLIRCEHAWVGCREVAYELSHALNVCRGTVRCAPHGVQVDGKDCGYFSPPDVSCSELVRREHTLGSLTITQRHIPHRRASSARGATRTRPDTHAPEVRARHLM